MSKQGACYYIGNVDWFKPEISRSGRRLDPEVVAKHVARQLLQGATGSLWKVREDEARNSEIQIPKEDEADASM